MTQEAGAPPSALLPGESDGLAGLPAHWQVPAFAVRRLAPRQSRHCVLIPVLNEGDRLEIGELTVGRLRIREQERPNS